MGTREITSKVAEMAKAIQAQGEAAVSDLFKATFEEIPELRRIIIEGETPYFNDGDPCVHRQEVFFDCGTRITGGQYIGDCSFEDALDDMYHAKTYLDTNEADEPRPSYETGTQWCTEARGKFREDIAKSYDAFEGILHGIYGTDFHLVITCDPDATEVKVEKHDHEEHD